METIGDGFTLGDDMEGTMDGSMTGGHMEMDSGTMMHTGHGVFSWRLDATLLWDWWQIRTPAQYAGSYFVIIMFGILREFIVYSRRKLRRRYSKFLDDIDKAEIDTESVSDDPQVLKWYHNVRLVRFLDSSLYMLQVTMSYFLMFIAMTFNPGLFIAVVLGIGLGYYFLLSDFPDMKRGKALRAHDAVKMQAMGEDCCD